MSVIYKSNCAPFPFHAFYVIPYDHWFDLTDEKHPEAV